MQEAEDFRAESRALHTLLACTNAERFEETTQFKSWSINDVLQHLHFWNEMANCQLLDEDRLKQTLKSAMGSKGGLRPFECEALGNPKGIELLDAWKEGFERTADTFAAADPKARLIWAGPSMSARSSITARLMETWAHGQEVYDVLGVDRANEDRIRGIVVLGINTFGWTYKTRGEEVPDQMPQVTLTAPSGEEWSFGEASYAGSICGKAEEFCQVVTQTRNVADTGLVLSGEVAADWMSKAQCFAGAATTPPAPGTRFTSNG